MNTLWPNYDIPSGIVLGIVYCEYRTKTQERKSHIINAKMTQLHLLMV